METVIIEGLSFALPLFIIAIGGIYSERSGITNLALEGLLGFGAFTGALSVTVFSRFGGTASPRMLFFMTLIFAVIGGMIYSMLHALLCIKFKANQVISGVVVNILAMALTAFLTSQLNDILFGKPSNKFLLDVCERFSIPGLSSIPVIGAFFKDLYIFVPIILVVALIAWYVMYKTRYGLRLRACGDNPHAVDAAGADVSRIRFVAVMVSGALAGLGGICFAYSITASFSPSIYAGYGYLAIAALIFGNWRIMPTLGACLLFGFARSGGYKLAQLLQLPSAFSDLIMILPYLLTLLLLIFFSSSNRAPRALGEIYDKGKR
ncbi:MAG: ABC transporter permease [Angelakisella sp.]|nr:ABC transporter permease [Angelakisella sp.]